MNKLINIIKKIENILISLEIILKEEYHNLLNFNISDKVKMLELIEKKTILLKKFFQLNQDRSSFEKKYGIFAPYKNYSELNNNWNEIIKKCFLLRKINLKNKILINKNLYLNQYFLEFFPLYKKSITYNFNGNIKI